VRWHRLLGPAVVVLAFTACEDRGAPTAPRLPTASPPIPIEATGPVQITFLESMPVPGGTITGCGARVSGCENRVLMRFSLRGEAGGPVLWFRAFLHATNLRACLQAATGPFELPPRQTREVMIVFDRSEDCGTPLDIATLAVVVEGPAEVASRRTWAITYRFLP
jgi:hypothetical protein